MGRIAQDDDEAASRFGEALLDHVDLLGRFPRMGSTIRKRSRVRKLVPTPILGNVVGNVDREFHAFTCPCAASGVKRL